jgi:tripartite-type tricarboxylate transporter receptor subunit TctC
MFIRKIIIALAMVPIAAVAWEPTKPVTVIFPNGPGAGNEISFRIIADQIEKNAKVKFVSEYKPGADGNIAGNYFNNAKPDGYTVMVPACQSNWVTPDIWHSKIVKYDAQHWEPVANIARSPLAFWANPSSPIKTPEELVALIKSKSRPVNIAIGGSGHKLAVEYLRSYLDVPGGDLVATPMYKGPAQALLDVMGGSAEFGVTPVTVGWPHVQSGKLKLIGIADTYTLPGLETQPLMTRVVPNLSIHGCWNLVLPPGTPQEIQSWYHDHFVPTIRNPHSAEKFKENMMYITPAEHTPQGVRASMYKLRQQWQPVAKRIAPQ